MIRELQIEDFDSGNFNALDLFSRLKVLEEDIQTADRELEMLWEQMQLAGTDPKNKEKVGNLNYLMVEWDTHKADLEERRKKLLDLITRPLA